MKQNDFRAMLEKTSGYETFMIKAQEYQEEKNMKRKKKERWNEGKVERATIAMWIQFVENLYETVSSNVECTPQNRSLKWQQFLAKHQIVDNFSESVSEIVFE